MRVSRGDNNDYFGMDLDYRNKGKVKVIMVSYLKNFLKEFPEAIVGVALSPYSYHISNVRYKKYRRLLD